MIRYFLLVLILLLDSSASAARVLVIVIDGLRPDYVTAELMPNLHAMGERGVRFSAHHSVFPTVTRVNASSLATGAYPGTHGLMGNSVYFPEVNAKAGLSTSDVNNLIAIENATGGNLLTAKSVGEVLEENGLTHLAVSSGSTGSAFLLNHKAREGGVIHTDMVVPESRTANVLKILGPAPPDGRPNAGRNARAVNAYLSFGLDEIHPDLTYMWLSDPDHTAHDKGIGAPDTLESLRLVDAELGRILATHKQRGLDVNIFVTADHGFSTHRGGANLSALLRRHALNDDVVIVNGAIYVKDHDAKRIRDIVRVLQDDAAIGAIFTRARRPLEMNGSVVGTLSFHAVHWDHERSADILVSANWSDDKNEFGYAGSTTQGGVAGHGTSSPYDIRLTLFAEGPDIKRGLKSNVPTSNVDIAPTALSILGIAPPDGMTGRVLKEALVDGPDPVTLEVKKEVQVEQTSGYRLELHESSVLGSRYVDFTVVQRR